MKRWVALLAASGCASLQLPATVEICGLTDCGHPTAMPLFWGSDRPPFVFSTLAEVSVEASEVPHLSSAPVTRDQMLESLALKARAVGATALMQVEVDLPPATQPPAAPAASQTQLGTLATGSARAVAIRQQR